jgi:penicillin amidase
VIELAAPEELALLTAYVEGVNAGLNALEAKPPEYLALRMEPRPWTAEDSVLVLASMFLTLQDSEGQREARLAAVYEALPSPLADFVTSTASDWETPLAGEPRGLPPIPGASVFNVRTAPRVTPAAAHPPAKADAGERSALLASLSPPIDDDARGSNNWAVADRLTRDGGAIVANDMHLGSRRRTSGTARRWLGRTRGPAALPASRFPACRRSSPAATATLPGDSPTRKVTGATWLSLSAIPPTRVAIARPPGCDPSMSRTRPSR